MLWLQAELTHRKLEDSRMKKRIILLSLLALQTSAAPTPTKQIADQAKQKKLMHEVDRALREFIAHHYDQPAYPRILTHNHRHFLSMLERLSSFPLTMLELSTRQEYAQTILKLFNDKLKATEFIDYAQAEHTLRTTGNLLAEYLAPSNAKLSLTTIEQLIEQTIQGILRQSGPMLTHVIPSALSPFLAKAEKKRQIARLHAHSDEWHLRMLITRFVDTLLSKTMWDHHQHERIWPSFIHLAHAIKKLTDSRIIIDVDTYDSLLWALVYRFCYFVELTGSALPLDFYDNIRFELASGSCAFLAREQDDIATKQEIIERTLHIGKTKALAFQQVGIISNGI